MDYNKEELKLYKENIACEFDHQYKFKVEDEISADEKLEFIDKMCNGRGSYFFELANKYEEEKKTLKRDKWGINVDTRSIRGWLKRNDYNDIVCKEKGYRSDVGDMNIIGYGCQWRYNVINPRYYMHLSGDSSLSVREYHIKEWFHHLLICLANEEKRMFQSTDEKSILIKKITELYNRGEVRNKTVSNIAYHKAGENLDIPTLTKVKERYNEANEKLLKLKRQYDELAKELADSLEKELAEL